MRFEFIMIAFVAAFTICFFYIEVKWKFYENNGYPFSNIDILRKYNLLSRVWPCDNEFCSLKFSALRHTLVPMVFSALIWFINVPPLNSALTFLGILYVLSPVSRYRERRRDYNGAGESSKDLLKPVKSACFSIIVLSVFNYLILMVCYGARP